MRRKTIYLLSWIVLSLSSFAQYSTPGTGVNWGPFELAEAAGDAILSAGPMFDVLEDITISPGDTIDMGDFSGFELGPGVRIFIEGRLEMNPSFSGLGIKSMDPQDPGIGLVFQEGSSGHLIGGGMNVFDIAGFEIYSDDVFISASFTSCHLTDEQSAVIELSGCSPSFSQCVFEENEGPAIQSPSNIGSSPQITSCSFISNNTANSNQPQINLGPSLSDVPILIEDCELIGGIENDLVGGIACSSFFGIDTEITVRDNLVEGHRYGIAIIGGNIQAEIIGNIIEANSIQGVPFEGGSGINLNGPSSSHAMVEGNEIRDNLWGITVQNDFGVDLGSIGAVEGSDGGNIFLNNGNDGEQYALFNNTPSDISAQGNCWVEDELSSTESIEAVIFHQVDDAELGLVDFSSPLCVTSLAESSRSLTHIYPNPANGWFYLDTDQDIAGLMFFDVNGRLVSTEPLNPDHRIEVGHLPRGLYTVLGVMEEGHFTQRIVID